MISLMQHYPQPSRTKHFENRLGKHLSWAVVSILIAGPLLNLHALLAALPTFLQLSLLVAGTVYLVHKLLTFPRWNDELQYVGPFVRAVVVLLIIIVVENFCTWATSASDQYKYEYAPLQDNVEIATLWAFNTSPLLRTLIMGWRVDMHFLLYSFVLLCLSVIWDQVPFSGFGIATRLIDTISWTHALRTVAFMVTVLPNPQLHCYERNFPPMPSSVLEFIAIGFGKKRGHGCNDLVISGHGVVYAVVPMAFKTFYPNRLTTAVTWAAVTKLCLQEVVDKTHYSVDMLLAVACTALVWVWREHVYPTTAKWSKRAPRSRPDPVPKRLIGLVVGVLVIVFVGVAGV